MNDTDAFTHRVTDALRDTQHLAPPNDARATATAAREIGGQLRTRRRRLVLSGGVAACVIAAAAVGVTAAVRNPAAPMTDTAAVLPANQPDCPNVLPARTPADGVIDGSGPTVVLGTVCQFDPTTERLPIETGQVRPVDLPDFMSFIRGLRQERTTHCQDGPAIAVISIELRLADDTLRSLTVRSTKQCATISDGDVRRVVAIKNLTGAWASVIDPAIPLPAPSSEDATGTPTYTTPAPAGTS